MCGIAGIYSSKLSRDVMKEKLQGMLSRMQHRGPNGQQTFFDDSISFGHARLSVIDPSVAGNQPMTINGVTLIYNGELYNFREKRSALEKEGVYFKGHSDAEVLLQLYLKYGMAFLNHLRGMYAFAIWDSRTQTLVCARDPLGIKPFLYTEIDGGIIFASELKSLLGSKLINRTVNRHALRCLLERGSITQPLSILEHVKWLLPGHMMIIKKNASPIIEKFYSIQPEKENYQKFSPKDLIEVTRTRITDSLERQLISDVPLGAFLSGGLDSSLLVALMAGRHKDVRTFSVGFEGIAEGYYDETSDAEEVAKHLGVKHTKISIAQDDIKNSIHKIARGLDHPTVDGVNSWYVSKAAKASLVVAISGTGGDELFSGYGWFKAMQERENSSLKTKLKSFIKQESFQDYFSKQYFIFTPEQADVLVKATKSPEERMDVLKDSSVLNRVTGLLLNGYTRDQLLADIDTSSMDHGLEVRVPLLDERLLEFALALPDHCKLGKADEYAPTGSYAATGTKSILMDIAKPLLPENFAYRSKRGFTLPFDIWLNGTLRPLMDELLSESVVAKRGFFDPAAVQEIKNSYLNKKIHYTRPWLLMMTELWAREVLDA